mmetsp:Transcript_64738/g.130218  ORF Transcript_64738/g.130218 Transcript_64738/m.130218 type:complete len:348 (+) Transcript_64738:12-1055(+)
MNLKIEIDEALNTFSHCNDRRWALLSSVVLYLELKRRKAVNQSLDGINDDLITAACLGFKPFLRFLKSEAKGVKYRTAMDRLVFFERVMPRLLEAGFPDQSDYTVTFDWLIKNELTNCKKIDIFLMTPDELEAESTRATLEAAEAEEADTLFRFNARRQYCGGEAAAEVEEPDVVALAVVVKAPIASVVTEAVPVAVNDGAEVAVEVSTEDRLTDENVFEDFFEEEEPEYVPESTTREERAEARTLIQESEPDIVAPEPDIVTPEPDIVAPVVLGEYDDLEYDHEEDEASLYEGSVAASDEEEELEDELDEPVEDLYKLSKLTLVARLLKTEAEICVLKARIVELEA